MTYGSGIAGGIHAKGLYTQNTVDGVSEIQVTGACQYQTFSRIAIVRRNYDTSSTATISDSRNDVSGANGAQWGISGGELLLNVANTIQVGASSGAGFTTGVEHVVGVSYDGTNVKFFLDGRLVGSGSNAQTFVIDSSATLFSRGGSTGVNEQLNGAIGLHADFEGALPESVMKSLTANPWQLYAPRKRQIYVDVAAGGTTLVTASDSLTPGFTEALALLSTSAVSDTLAPGLTESPAILITSSISDTATPSVSESVGLAVLVSATDTVTPNVTETAEVIAAVMATDTLTPTLVEAQASFVTSALSEAFTLSLGETQGSLLASAVTDVATVSVSESAAVLVAMVGSDTYVVSITDSAAVVIADTIAKAVTESLTLSLTEVASIVTASLWTDKAVAITVWTDKPDASTTWTTQ